ncbi:hypothetical protein Tco_1367253, partial [Tanacetum coccineum]
EFSVASARKVIDDNMFSEVSTQTRWIKAVSIKVNIHVWKVRMDCLSTRLNISRRDNFRKICRWWEVDFMEVHTFDEWVSRIVNLRIPIKHKRLLEGLQLKGVDEQRAAIYNFKRRCIDRKISSELALAIESKEALM